MVEHKLSRLFKERNLLLAPEGGPMPLYAQVLMDADGLVALVKEDDSNHQKALHIVDRLEQKGVFFLITPFTVPECVTVLSYKVSHNVACEFLQEVRTLDLGEFEVSEFHDKLKERVDGIFLQEEKNRTSYFDCVNIAYMERFHLDAIFSFDKIYHLHHLRYADEW